MLGTLNIHMQNKQGRHYLTLINVNSVQLRHFIANQLLENRSGRNGDHESFGDDLLETALKTDT